MNEELRQMKGQVIQQRQEELKQKVELIREIKRLEQIKREMKNDKKVLNKEQTSGSGLLCEMSLHQVHNYTIMTIFINSYNNFLSLFSSFCFSSKKQKS